MAVATLRSPVPNEPRSVMAYRAAAADATGAATTYPMNRSVAVAPTAATRLVLRAGMAFGPSAMRVGDVARMSYRATIATAHLIQQRQLVHSPSGNIAGQAVPRPVPVI